MTHGPIDRTAVLSSRVVSLLDSGVGASIDELVNSAPMLVTDGAIASEYDELQHGDMVTFGTRKSKWIVIDVTGKGTNSFRIATVKCVGHPLTDRIGRESEISEERTLVWKI